MANHYGIQRGNLTAEVHQVRRLIERKRERGQVLNTTRDFLSVLRPYKDAFEDLHRLLRIALTLPVSSASCERSFSCLSRVKNYLRTRSGDDRTSGLGVLAINSERARALDCQEIIDAFAVNHNNRRIVLL